MGNIILSILITKLQKVAEEYLIKIISKCKDKKFSGKKRRRDKKKIHKILNNKIEYNYENEEQGMSLDEENTNIIFNNYMNENNITNIQKNNILNNINNEKNEIIIGSGIIDGVKKMDLNDLYSYKLISNKHSFYFKKGTIENEKFTVCLLNNGRNMWLENKTFIKCIAKNCPEVEIEDTKLDALEKNEHKNFDIKFSNLNKCQIGKYIAFFVVKVNDEEINDGKKFFIEFEVYDYS